MPDADDSGPAVRIDRSTADGRVAGGKRETSWSANLEGPEHETDRERVLTDAVDAVAATAPGRHVNLVTHGAHGHPRTYLWDELRSRLSNASFDLEYVDRCGCGGHVTRVHVREA